MHNQSGDTSAGAVFWECGNAVKVAIVRAIFPVWWREAAQSGFSGFLG